jgi:allantoicase
MTPPNIHDHATGTAAFTDLPDLAVRALGGSVVAANDELFAAKENLVRTSEPVHSPRTYGTKGQVYDGWETRRRREPGHDWAIVRLGVPGVVRGVVVDTAFFRGNYPPECSVEACRADGYPSPDELASVAWTTIVARSAVAGDTRNEFAVTSAERFTHVRLTIYPDGGVARLRVNGEPVPDPRAFAGMPLDLAAIANGGRVLDASNRFYARPDNLLLPGPAQVMGDGWETARRRTAGNDWVVVRLAGRGEVRVVELDTTHFVGNAPATAALRGLDAGEGDVGERVSGPDDNDAWVDLLPITRLQPDTPHRFVLATTRPVTHVRLDIYPDGGMSRLRCFGTLTAEAYDRLLRRWDGRPDQPSAS